MNPILNIQIHYPLYSEGRLNLRTEDRLIADIPKGMKQHFKRFLNRVFLQFLVNQILFHVKVFCGLVVRVPGYRSRGPGFDSRRYQIF
jgi:hypothetical protein